MTLQDAANQLQEMAGTNRAVTLHAICTVKGGKTSTEFIASLKRRTSKLVLGQAPTVEACIDLARRHLHPDYVGGDVDLTPPASRRN